MADPVGRQVKTEEPIRSPDGRAFLAGAGNMVYAPGVTSDSLSKPMETHERWSSGGWTSAVVIGALILICLALQVGESSILLGQKALSAPVKAVLADPSGHAILSAIPAATGLLGIIVARSMLVVFVLLAVEYVLAGPPRSWRLVGFALLVQTLSLVFIVATVSIAGKLIGPTDIPPLLRLAGNELPPALRLFEPLIGATLLLLTASFADYWAHRALHAFPALWRFHSVHHSIEELDVANSYIHPVDILLSRTSMLIIATVVQIDFNTLAFAVALTMFQGALSHSRAPVNFGLLAPILVDNRHHFIHHSILPQHYDKNFAVYFTLWDRVFGTYVAPTAAHPPTGLTDRLPPRSLWQFATGALDDRPDTNVEDRARHDERRIEIADTTRPPPLDAGHSVVERGA